MIIKAAHRRQPVAKLPSSPAVSVYLKEGFSVLIEESSQKLPPRFSSVSMTTTQSSRTVCITCFIRFSGIATQPPV